MAGGRGQALLAALVWSLLAVAGPAMGQEGVGGGTIVVVETSAGAFAFETFPTEAPKTVAHILQLVRNGFYDGQRFHLYPQTREHVRGRFGADPFEIDEVREPFVTDLHP